MQPNRRSYQNKELLIVHMAKAKQFFKKMHFQMTSEKDTHHTGYTEPKNNVQEEPWRL
jgi:hypothetical protein